MTEWHPLRSLDANDCEESELSRQLWKELDKSAEDVGRVIANNSPATMPTLEHSSMTDYEYVYEPSDDTYLLIDAIKYDLFSGYPSGTNSSGGDNDEKATTNTSDNEEESISRAALEFYYHRARIQSRNTMEETEGDDEGGRIIQDFVEKEGYCSDRKSRILSRLLSRLKQLRRLERINVVIEIGTGSGVPITYLSKRLLLEKPNLSHIIDNDENIEGFSVIATDLNPLALEFAKKTAEENGVVISENINNNNNTTCIQSIEFVECDLATPLLHDCEGAIDVLVFNPPYVPTEDSEITGNGIEISWAGGTDGRIIIDRALPQIARLLRKPDGVCYMITVDDNLPLQMATILKEDHGLDMVPLVRRRARNEYLSVQKISWLAPTTTTIDE